MTSANTIWALVAGLAVGFAVGREFPRHDHATSEPAPAATAGATGAGHTHDSPAAPGEIPPNWLKEAEFGATDAFAGLTPAQRYTALKVLNEMPCDCGCDHGSVALCKKQDPECPRAPTIIANAVGAARSGGSYDAVLAAARKRDTPAPQAGPPEPPQRVELASWTPIRGPRHAKVTIVEFSDFQCPFCGKASQTIHQVEQTYGQDVRIAYRHQPLGFHPFAMGAAEASMAAHAQGKFWEMHDKLFANQQSLDRASLDRYAKEIGLDMARFKADMDGHKHKAQIDADSRRGNEVGASGTPTFFINGQQLGGARNLASFRAIIDAEMKKADELLGQGVKIDKLYEAVLAKLPASAGAPAK